MKLLDRVWITELLVQGRIIAIYESEIGLQFSVRYFINSEVKQCYFFADELSVEKPS